MSSENEQTLDEIVSKIDGLNKAYGLHECAVFRGIAVRREDKWHNTVSTLTLVPKITEDLGERFEEFEPDHIVGFRVPMSAKEAEKTLKRILKKESYEVNDTNVEIFIDESKKPRWNRGREIGFYEARHYYPFECGLVEYFIDCKYHVAELGDIRESIRKHGYHDYREMIADRVFHDSGWFSFDHNAHSQSGIHVLIPHHHLSIESVEYDDNGIDISLRGSLPKKKLKDFFLTMRVHEDYNVMHSPTKVDPLKKMRIHIPSVGTKYGVHAELWWRRGKSRVEDFVDSFRGDRRLGSGNARVISYLHFDPELKALTKQLSVRHKDSKRFEWGVAMLLYLAGFDTSWLGYPGDLLESEIDVLAFAPDLAIAIAAECTVSSGDIAKKVADLQRKVAELGEVLEDWEIATAIFTNLRLDGLAHHVKEAATEQGVLLIPWEGIMDILSLMKKGSPRKLIFDEMRNRLLVERSKSLWK
jgi:hypothetical protein